MKGVFFMSYLINAWLEHGEPRLAIVNAQTGVVQLMWRLKKIGSSYAEPLRREIPRVKPSGTQQLTKELFLLGCAEDISLVQRAHAGNMSDVCLNCNRCAEDIATVNMITQYTNSIKRGTA
jgi:hypothetical protein